MADIMDKSKNSKLKCGISKMENAPFFSLVDYRNNYFTSSESEKIMGFYEGFENSEQLVKWMSDRPGGVSRIFEVEGNKEIVVVIPTGDFKGKYAKRCSEEIFTGLHLVFVESGGRGDFYFNYAHNCNIGVKKALEYNPKWIVVSNDDMVKIDDVDVLRNELSNLNPEKLKTVFTGQSSYHSYSTTVGIKRRIIGELGYLLNYSLKGKLRDFLDIKRILKKYNVAWDQGPRNLLLSKIFLKVVHTFVIGSCFSILSGKWCEKVGGNVYNECYINGVEDWEQSIMLTMNSADYSYIRYKIGDLVGQTMPADYIRSLRNVCNVVYFNARIEHFLGKNDI